MRMIALALALGMTTSLAPISRADDTAKTKVSIDSATGKVEIVPLDQNTAAPAPTKTTEKTIVKKMEKPKTVVDTHQENETEQNFATNPVTPGADQRATYVKLVPGSSMVTDEHGNCYMITNDKISPCVIEHLPQAGAEGQQ